MPADFQEFWLGADSDLHTLGVVHSLVSVQQPQWPSQENDSFREWSICNPGIISHPSPT